MNVVPKIQRRAVAVAIALSLVPVLLGCEHLQAEPPYVISRAQVHVGAYEPFYDLAGAHIAVANMSQKTVRGMQLSFLLFDADGVLCGVPGRPVTADYAGTIAPHQVREAVIPLDAAVGSRVRSAYSVGNLFVSKITYDDGTEWSDALGLHAMQGAE